MKAKGVLVAVRVGKPYTSAFMRRILKQGQYAEVKQTTIGGYMAGALAQWYVIAFNRKPRRGAKAHG